MSHRDMAARIQRRREAALRLPPLKSGHRDPCDGITLPWPRYAVDLLRALRHGATLTVVELLELQHTLRTWWQKYPEDRGWIELAAMSVNERLRGLTTPRERGAA